MRPSVGLLGLLLVAAPAVLAQDGSSGKGTTASQTNTDNSKSTDTAKTTNSATTGDTKTTAAPSSTAAKSTASSLSTFKLTDAPNTSSSTSATKSTSESASTTDSVFHLSDVPTIAGVGVPDIKVPDTAGAPFMQKSNLPDGTVFICVGAVLAFLGVAVLAWRGLVAWSLHRSVKRAAVAQNLADMKAMTAVPGKKRGLYNVVGANSNMSLDRLSAAPTGTSKPPKPFSSSNAGAPLKSTSSLFFSPTAGGSTGLRDSAINRSSNYLPAGYYAAGTAQPASGSPMTHIGGQGSHLSTHSLHNSGNRFSSRSGISPPGSPSLPPSHGYDRAPPSRDGASLYNRNSVATVNSPAPRGGAYAHDHGNPSQLSLNVPGGTSAPGGRAPSAYLEDLFENHGSGPRERY